MRSFVQHVRSKQVTNLAETAFSLMAERGVNPCKFLEWYATEGVLFNENQVPDEAIDWLSHELLLAEINWGGFWPTFGSAAAGGATGALAGSALGPLGAAVGGTIGAVGGADFAGNKANQQAADKVDPAKHPSVGQAMTALDALSRNLPKSFAEKQPFIQSLHALIAILRNPVATGSVAPPTATVQRTPAPTVSAGAAPTVSAGAAPTVSTGAAPTVSAATAPTVAHYNPQQDFLGSMIFERKVRSACSRLAEHGIDPRSFANWYITEGRHLRNEEAFKEGFGDFMQQAWAGAGEWWGGGKFVDGYNRKKQELQTQRERDAVGSATHALQQLKAHVQQVNIGGPDIMKHIDLMLKELTASTEAQKNQPPAEEKKPGEEGGAPQQSAPIDPQTVEMIKEKLKAQGVDVDTISPEVMQFQASQITQVPEGPEREAKIAEIAGQIKAQAEKDASATGDPANKAPLQKAPWAKDLDISGGNPEDPTFIQNAVQLYGNLPEDQKIAVGMNAKRLWKKKGEPMQNDDGRNQDIAKAMYIMATGHDMSHMPHEQRRARKVVTEHDDFMQSLMGQMGKRPKNWFN